MKDDHHFRAWQPAFDMPHNREQALAVIKAWSSASCMTFSSERCKRVYECLSNAVPSPLPPATRYLPGLGWQWGDADGWHGNFSSNAEAFSAGYAAALRKVAVPSRPRCSVCNDNPGECSKNYSGGWVGTLCPN